MINKEQINEYITTALNGLEKSVKENDKRTIYQNTQSFNSLISEYKRIIGRNETQKYLNNYTEIINGRKY